MSLLFRRSAIVRAVAGDLPPADETRLRVHMVGCSACRQHYDELMLIAGAAGAGRSAAERARARLFRALGGPSEDARTNAHAAAAPPRGRGWRLAALTLVPAAAALIALVVREPADPTGDAAHEAAPGDEAIGWRGAGNTSGSSAAEADEAARAGLSLRFYASRKERDGAAPGPLRLLGELPASGELRASRGDYLQLAYAGLREPRHLVVVGVDEAGTLRRFHPRGAAGPSVPLQPVTGAPKPLGASVDLGAHAPGRIFVFGAVSPQALDVAAVEAQAREAARSRRLPSGAFGGVLILEPQ